MAKGISIRGLAKDVATVHGLVEEIIHRIEKHTRDVAEGEALVATNQVKWRFKEHGVDTFTPYPREINALLEKAYQEKAGCYTGKRLGFVFMVDFGQMKEQRQNSNGFFEVSRIQNRECHDDFP
jgi:hypothetical protein